MFCGCCTYAIESRSSRCGRQRGGFILGNMTPPIARVRRLSGQPKRVAARTARVSRAPFLVHTHTNSTIGPPCRHAGTQRRWAIRTGVGPQPSDRRLRADGGALGDRSLVTFRFSGGGRRAFWLVVCVFLYVLSWRKTWARIVGLFLLWVCVCDCAVANGV